MCAAVLSPTLLPHRPYVVEPTALFIWLAVSLFHSQGCKSHKGRGFYVLVTEHNWLLEEYLHTVGA